LIESLFKNFNNSYFKIFRVFSLNKEIESKRLINNKNLPLQNINNFISQDFSNNNNFTKNDKKSIVSVSNLCVENKYYHKITSFHYNKNSFNNIRNNLIQNNFNERKLKEFSNENRFGNNNNNIYFLNNLCNQNNFFTYFQQN